MPRTIVVLPTPGPPVITATLAGERGAHRLGLLARERDPRLASRTRRARAPVDLEARRAARRAACAARPPARASARYRPRLVHGGRARVLDDRCVDRDVARPGEPIDRRVGALLGQIQQRRRLLHEPRPRHEHVAVAGFLVEHVAHARLDARRRVARDAQRRRQLVGRQEPDAPHVERQPVRVLAHARDRRGAVALVDARRERGRDAVALQEHHHLAHLALRAPAVADRARARRPDARGPR